MAPQYGEVRVDYITYTTGVSPNEANVTVLVSGLVNNPTFSGNVIIEGNTTIDGDLTVSGSINASGVIISGITGLFDDGTEALPSIAFASDPDTGIYKPATNEIGISTNASEALRIDNNGNVGIGTTDPQARLDVESISDTPSLTFNNSGQAIIGDSATQLAIGRVTTSPFSVYLQARASNNAARNIALAPLGGNVGVGTSSPTSLLHLAANAPYITFEDIDNNQDWQLQATAWFALRNQTTASELVRVTTDGKVGIGTSNPQTQLQVVGDVLLGPSNATQITASNHAGTQITPDLQISSEVNANPSISLTNVRSNTLGIGCFIFNKANGNLAAPTALGSSQTIGAMVFNGYDGSNYVRAAQIQSGADGTIGTGAMPGLLSFLTSAAGSSTPTERMRIDSAGNVGISQSVPAYTLDVFAGALGDTAGNLVDILRLGSNTTSNTGNPSVQLLFVEERLVNGTNWNNTQSRIQRRIGSTDQGYISFTAQRGALGTAKDVAIGYGTTEVLRVTNGERVGIMTSEPERVFDVKGSFLLGPADTSSEFQGQSLRNGKDSSAAETVSFIDFQNNLTTPDCHIFARHKTDGSSALEFGTTSAGDRSTDRRLGLLYLVEANVGILTADPKTTLDVVGPLRATIVYVGSTQNGAGQTKLALINNDGGGNSNLAFNDASGVAMQNGSCARITADTDSTTGALVFKVGDNSTANTTNTKTDVMVLKSSVVNVNKNINMGSGTGVKFDNSTTLDDYEEGIFTPTVQDATTYAVQNGYYTKVGNLVTFAIRVQPTAGTPSATILTVGGLPFPCESIAGGPYGGAFRTLGTLVDDSVVSNLNWHIPVNQTLFRAYTGSSTINTNATGVNIVGNFIFHGFYYTDE